MRRIIHEYWLEFIALVIFATGGLLIIKEISIMELLRLIIHNATSYLGSWAQSFIAHFSINDLFGGVLVLAGLAIVIWRGQYHFLRSEYWQAVNCPKCGSGLHRIHRTTWDRFLTNTLLRDARRYRCKNAECGWSGLRQRREEDRHHHRHDSPDEPA